TSGALRSTETPPRSRAAQNGAAGRLGAPNSPHHAPTPTGGGLQPATTNARWTICDWTDRAGTPASLRLRRARSGRSGAPPGGAVGGVRVGGGAGLAGVARGRDAVVERLRAGFSATGALPAATVAKWCISRDLRRAALFRWIIPFSAALSSARTAALSASPSG